MTTEEIYAALTGIIKPERDINLLGCTTEDELYNGSSYRRARKPTPPTPIATGCGLPYNAYAYCREHEVYFSGRAM